jgi:hypothetical protein
MQKLLLIPSPNDLFIRPIHWVTKHLLFYFFAALAAGIAFVVGAALYAYVVPVRPLGFAPLPSEVLSPEPMPTPSPHEEAVAAADDFARHPIVLGIVGASRSDIPFQETIGAKVVDTQMRNIGRVRTISVSPSGEAKVEILKQDGSAVHVPVENFIWRHAREDSIKHSDPKVKAILKPAVKPDFAPAPSLFLK